LVGLVTASADPAAKVNQRAVIGADAGLGVGGTWPSRGIGGEASAWVQYKNVLYTARVFRWSQWQLELGADEGDVVRNPDESGTSFAAMIGLATTETWYTLSASTGLGVAAGERRGTLLKSEQVDTGFLTPTGKYYTRNTYQGIKYWGLEIPLEAKASLRLFDFVGLGMKFNLSLNTNQIWFGLSPFLELAL
jgi:hypothetical protein